MTQSQKLDGGAVPEEDSQTLPAATVPSDEDLITQAAAGTLLDLLDSEDDHAPADSLLNRAVQLHNAARIDLLSDQMRGAVDKLAGTDFFQAQQLMGELIPKLDGPIASMMVMVKLLVEKGGNDGMAMYPLEAFKGWLAADLSRADQIIADFHAGSTDDAGYLAAALQVRGDPALIYPFLKFSDPRRQFAASALGTIRPTDDAAAQTALTELLAIASADSQEMTRFTAIFTAWEILQHLPHLAAAWTARFIAAVQADPSYPAMEALLQGLWRKTNLFDDQAVSDSLSIVMAADLSVDRLRGVLFVTIGRLVETPHSDKALDAITTLVQQGLLTLENNGPILHHLHRLDKGRIFDIVIRWLRTGDFNLCHAATAIAIKAAKGVPFVADLSGAGLTSDEIIAVAKRAVSYFFVHPTVATSIVLAGIRAKNAKATPELTGLLYFPLLLNYLGSVQDYLKAVKKGDAAYASARKALKLAADYSKGLDIKGPIKELRPSDSQLNIARERQMELNRQMHKQVRKESVLLSLVRESTILYGRSTMTYTHGAEKPPMKMDMHAYSHSIEVPRLDILDPVGLAWMLFRFRVNRP